MDFDKLVFLRKPVKAYTSEKVSRELIMKVLDSARMAPSENNTQPWIFLACESEQTLHKLQEAYPREWFKNVPTCIVVCGDRLASWKRPSDDKDFCEIDVAIACDFICFKAAEIGLSTCPITNFDAKRVAFNLSLPHEVVPIMLIAIGYEDMHAEKPYELKKRKKLNDIVRWL